jgi:thiol:disulfide interchange protein DsbA
LRGLLASLALLLALGAGAQAAPPAAGRDYLVLEPARPTAPGRIEVLEFFYYGCPVCYEAQPHLNRWKQGAAPDVELRRVPAVSNESWLLLARAHFALEALGELQRLHWPLYDTHHFDDRRLDQEENLYAWVAANGVDESRFRAAMSSVDTRQKIEFAHRMGGMHRVRAVPTLVVGGRYATSARMAGGVKEMIVVLEHLVDRVRQERATK